MRKRIVAGVAAVAIMSSVAVAQDAAVTPEPERRELEVTIGSAEMPAQRMIGSTVVNRSGEPIGTIIDLQLASATAAMPGSTESEIQSGEAPPQEDAPTDPADMTGAGESPDSQPAADVSEEASDEVEKVIISLDQGRAASASSGTGAGNTASSGTPTTNDTASATGGAKPFPQLSGRVIAVDLAQLEPAQGGTNRFALSMDEAELQSAEQFQYEEGSEYFTMMEAESGAAQQ